MNAKASVQATSEFRQGLWKTSGYLIFAVILLCMFLLGHDVWTIHDSQEVIRSQLLENKWDEADAAVMYDVTTLKDLYKWLRNVWAPGA